MSKHALRHRQNQNVLDLHSLEFFEGLLRGIRGGWKNLVQNRTLRKVLKCSVLITCF